MSQLFLPKNLDVDLGLLQASLRIGQLDSTSFARSGYLLALNALVSRSQLGASQDYDRYDVEVRAAFSHGTHTLRLAMRGGGSIGDDALPVYAMFRLGGFLNMSGFRLQQLLGTRFVYGRALYQARLGSVPLFEGVYAGLAYEIADMPQAVPLNLFSSVTQCPRRPIRGSVWARRPVSARRCSARGRTIAGVWSTAAQWPE